MRTLSGLLAAALVVFVVLQINTPEGWFWAIVYGVSAFWMLVASIRPSTFDNDPIAILLGVCLAIAALFTYVFWPQVAEWWTRAVWWEDKDVRRSIGMIIAFLALLFAGFTALRERAN